MAEIAISVDHLDKMYKLYDKPIDRLKESLGLTKKKKYREHYALRDVSFEVRRGRDGGYYRNKWFRKIYGSQNHNREC